MCCKKTFKGAEKQSGRRLEWLTFDPYAGTAVKLKS